MDKDYRTSRYDTRHGREARKSVGDCVEVGVMFAYENRNMSSIAADCWRIAHRCDGVTTTANLDHTHNYASSPATLSFTPILLRLELEGQRLPNASRISYSIDDIEGRPKQAPRHCLVRQCTPRRHQHAHNERSASCTPHNQEADAEVRHHDGVL